MAASEERRIQITGTFRDQINQSLGKIGRGLDATAAKLRTFGRALVSPITAPLRALDAFGKKIGGVQTLITGFFAVVAARRAFSAFEGIANDLDRIAKVSQQLGTTTESLSAMRHAAELGGVQFEALTTSVRVFERNLEQARAGAREQADAFRDLGLDIEKISSQEGIDLVELFKQLAVQLQSVESATARTSILVRALGKQGAELAPLLLQGPEGIEEAVKKAQQAGLVFSRDQLARATRLVDAITELRAAFRGLTSTLVIEGGPKIAALFTKLRTFITENRDEIVTAAKAVGEALLRVIDVATDGAIGLVGILERIPGAFKAPEGVAAEFARVNRELERTEKLLARARGELPQGPLKVFPQAIPALEEQATRLRRQAEEIGEQLPGGIADGLRRRKADLVESLRKTVEEMAAPAGEGGKAAGEAFADGFGQGADLTGAIRKQLQEQRQALGAVRSLIAIQPPSREVELQLAAIGAELQKLDFQALAAEGVISAEQLAFALGQVDAAAERTAERLRGSFAAGFSDAADRILEKWTDLTAFGEEAAATLIDGGLNNLTGALGDWISGTKKAKEAFRDFAADTLRLLAQLIAKFAALQLVRGLTGQTIALEKGGVIPLPLERIQKLPIRHYDVGGVARSPQLAIFGEGRRSLAEAFVPLPDGRSIPVEMRGRQSAGLTLIIQAIDHRDVAHWLTRNRGLLLAIQRDGAERIVATRHAIRGAVA